MLFTTAKSYLGYLFTIIYYLFTLCVIGFVYICTDRSSARAPQGSITAPQVHIMR